jgi:hypothetical protein
MAAEVYTPTYLPAAPWRADGGTACLLAKTICWPDCPPAACLRRRELPRPRQLARPKRQIRHGKHQSWIDRCGRRWRCDAARATVAVMVGFMVGSSVGHGACNEIIGTRGGRSWTSTARCFWPKIVNSAQIRRLVYPQTRRSGADARFIAAPKHLT